MVDFLKSNPTVTMDDYIWKLNPALIKLMMYDNSHVRYLTEEEAKSRHDHIIDGTNLTNDLGVPIL